MNLSDSDILFLQSCVATQRDAKAYKSLFFHFHAPLYRFANNLLKNVEVAEEVVSDVMMKVWDMGEKLADIERLNLYLFTSVKNASLSYLSKSKLQQVTINEVIENTVADKNDNPEQRLLLSEIEKKIETAVKNLPPQCQAVFRLIKEEGLCYKDVSSVLEISQNTIETHMRIALKKIRLALHSHLINK